MSSDIFSLIFHSANYNENYQPALVGIMQEKTVQNSLVTLRKLMLQIRSDKENRSDLDDVLGYLSRVIKSLASRSGLSAAVYAPILLLLRLSSVEEPVRLRFSVLLVIVSDLLLMVFYLFVEDPVLHAGCMFLFYLSLLLITVDCSPGKAAAEAPKEAENAAA